MNLFEKIQDFIKSLDEKKFIRYISIIIIIILLFTGFFIYRYFSKSATYKKQIQTINYQRQEAEAILSKHAIVKQQKEKVDEILKKGFKPIEYFETVTNKLGIEKNVKERSTSESTLENLTTQGYKEFKINVTFTDLNMKQLSELLDEIEKNERIYTKSLEITKSNKTPTIDVNLEIATLLPAEETVLEE